MNEENSNKNKSILNNLPEDIGILTIGWDLALPIVGGVLIGHAIDTRIETNSTFTLIFLVFGLMVAYYNLSRLIRILDRKDLEKRNSEEQKKI